MAKGRLSMANTDSRLILLLALRRFARLQPALAQSCCFQKCCCSVTPLTVGFITVTTTKEATMATSTTQPETTSQRKALAAKVAKDKDGGMTGQALREKYGSWLTGPERRKLLREFGHGHLVAASYDRAEAKAKREAAAKAREAASKAKPAKSAA
jgi:hypothetical protein